MSAQHTRGVWRLVAGEKSIRIVAGDSTDFRIICELQVCWDEEGNAEQRANAHLIAAAPELLEALIEAEEYFDDRADVVDGPYGEPQANKEMRVLETIRTALRAAGGEL